MSRFGVQRSARTHGCNSKSYGCSGVQPQLLFGALGRFRFSLLSEHLLQRARAAIEQSSRENSVANLLQMPFDGKNEKSCQSQVLDSKEVNERARQDSNLQPSDSKSATLSN